MWDEWKVATFSSCDIWIAIRFSKFLVPTTYSPSYSNRVFYDTFRERWMEHVYWNGQILNNDINCNITITRTRRSIVQRGHPDAPIEQFWNPRASRWNELAVRTKKQSARETTRATNELEQNQLAAQGHPPPCHFCISRTIDQARRSNYSRLPTRSIIENATLCDQLFLAPS